MSKAAIQASRFDAFWLEPEKLTLIKDQSSPFYQSRVEDEAQPGLVLSMKTVGFMVDKPITIFKDGPNLCVLDGRGRTIAALEANRQLRAEKREPIRVSAVLKKGTEAELYATQCAANENRRDVSDVERAKELSKLMSYGKTVEEAGAVLGFNRGRAERILALLDCAASVQKAVEAGQLPTTAAAKLAKLERAEQVIELKKLLEDSGGARVRVRTASKAVDKAKGMVRVERPNKKAIQALHDSPLLAVDAKQALHWILTGEAQGCVEAALALLRCPPICPPVCDEIDELDLPTLDA